MNKRKTFSDEETAQILHDHRQGLNLGELERKYGRTRTTIRRLLMRLGVEFEQRKYARKLTPEQEKSVVIDYGRGMTMDQIAKEYDCSSSTVKNVLDMNRVPVRSRGPKRQKSTETHKFCPHCQKMLPKSEFYADSKSYDGLLSHCKKCNAINHKLRTYGLSAKDFNIMKDEQQGRCAICCRTPQEAGHDDKHPDLVVDHDHETGAIRGLLCAHCNQALGHMQDDRMRLLNAADYLQRKRSSDQAEVG